MRFTVQNGVITMDEITLRILDEDNKFRIEDGHWVLHKKAIQKVWRNTKTNQRVKWTLKVIFLGSC